MLFRLLIISQTTTIHWSLHAMWLCFAIKWWMRSTLSWRETHIFMKFRFRELILSGKKLVWNRQEHRMIVLIFLLFVKITVTTTCQLCIRINLSCGWELPNTHSYHVNARLINFNYNLNFNNITKNLYTGVHPMDILRVNKCQASDL